MSMWYEKAPRMAMHGVGVAWEGVESPCKHVGGLGWVLGGAWVGEHVHVWWL